MYFVLENKSFKETNLGESDVFFILNNGYLNSLGLTFDKEIEEDGIYNEKYEIEWIDLENPINLKDFYELLDKYTNFQNNFTYLKTARILKTNNKEVEIEQELMFLFLKIIDLFNSSKYQYDIIQKLRISSSNNEQIENVIKKTNKRFLDFILYSDVNFNINEQKLELNLKVLKKQRNELIEKGESTTSLDKEINLLESELKVYSEEVNKVNNSINKLKIPANVLTETKNEIEKRIDFFNKYAGYILKIFIPIYSIFILIIFTYLLIVKVYSINLILYFTMFFPLIFSTILSFLLFRQANLKMKELETINKRFILIHEINQSLKALIEINIGKNMNNKTELIIDKLIDNILENATSDITTKNNKNDQNNLLNTTLSNLANLKTIST